MQPNVVVGTYTGTGSTIAVELGFTPDVVQILNQTDGGPMFVAFRGDTTNTAVSFSTIAGAIASGGVAFVDGSFGDTTDHTGRGFQVSGGTAGGFGMTSVNGKKYKYIATRSGAGQQNKLGN